EVTNVVRAASPTGEATGVETERPGERIRITKVSPFKLPNQMVAATGWLINNKGEVTLIASAPTIHGNKFLSSPTTCPN
ncbi:MAG: hypothetical protein ICV85_13255, partial [Tolypothrix sp. T3-bin4]|nr:hypothetical protein [Tolypothrix sp. T3-bin4]